MVATFLTRVQALQNFGLTHFSVLNSTVFRFSSTFWMDSTLKLSCVHKVIALVHVYENLTCAIY